MYIVLGDGEMTKKELTETLQELWDNSGDQPYWFIIQGKSEPSDTDKALVTWLDKNEVYYEVLTDDADAMDDIYGNAQETHVAKRLAQKVVNLFNSKPEEGETTAHILALYTSDDPAAEEDRWLNGVVQAASDAGFKSFVLNDGMVEVDFSEPEGDEDEEVAEVAEAAEEAEDVPTPKPSKQAAKKAPAAKPKAKASHTREELEELSLSELKEIAAAQDIELPPRTRIPTYIDHILGEAKGEAPAAEIDTPPITTTTSGNTTSSNTNATITSINGVSVESLAEAAAAIVMRKIAEALQGV
jgi:hypothetical protein